MLYIIDKNNISYFSIYTSSISNDKHFYYYPYSLKRLVLYSKSQNRFRYFEIWRLFHIFFAPIWLNISFCLICNGCFYTENLKYFFLFLDYNMVDPARLGPVFACFRMHLAVMLISYCSNKSILQSRRDFFSNLDYPNGNSFGPWTISKTSFLKCLSPQRL